MLGRPDATYRLKIQVARVRPPVWRRVEVPGSMTLDRLHLVVHLAMGWTGVDGYEFSLGQTTRDPYRTPFVPAARRAGTLEGDRWQVAAELGADDAALIPEEDLVEEHVQVCDVFTTPRSVLLYLYGVAWEHRIRVEGAVAGEPSRPRVVAGRRAVPPQYLVNAWNYSELVALVRDVAEGRGNPVAERDVASHFPGLSPAEALATVEAFDLRQADDMVAALHAQGRL